MHESFHPHRAQLFGIAYRMLGRVSDAEDMVQETWLRWQRQAPGSVQSPQAWLISTVTRLCIDQLRSARHQREEYYGVWLPEPLLQGPEFADAPSPEKAASVADSLTMAFMLLLETLNPVDRAIYLLREVFDYGYEEISSIVQKTPDNCRQIVRRAKDRLQQHPPAEAPPTEQAQRVVHYFVQASATGEMQDFLALLTEDAVLYSDGGGQVLAAKYPIQGASRIARFLIGIRKKRPEDLAPQFALINGRPGVVMHSGGQIYNVVTFEFHEGHIQAIYIMRNPQKLRHLPLRDGAPHHLTPSDATVLSS